VKRKVPCAQFAEVMGHSMIQRFWPGSLLQGTRKGINISVWRKKNFDVKKLT
jgi:hypothetical protein